MFSCVTELAAVVLSTLALENDTAATLFSLADSGSETLNSRRVHPSLRLPIDYKRSMGMEPTLLHVRESHFCCVRVQRASPFTAGRVGEFEHFLVFIEIKRHFHKIRIDRCCKMIIS